MKLTTIILCWQGRQAQTWSAGRRAAQARAFRIDRSLLDHEPHRREIIYEAARQIGNGDAFWDYFYWECTS